MLLLKEINHMTDEKDSFYDGLFKAVIGPSTARACEAAKTAMEPEEFQALRPETFVQRPTELVRPDGQTFKLDLSYTVETKGGHPLKIFLLFEHKSEKNPKGFFRQSLFYQAVLYEQMEEKIPILPILFYNGKRPWKGPFSFREYLGLDSQKTVFGDYYLDFRVKVCDMGRIDFNALSKDLTIAPFYYILGKRTRRLNEDISSEFFRLCWKHLRHRPTERKQILKAVSGFYASSMDKMIEAEKKHFTEGDCFMGEVKYGIEGIEEKALIRGRKKGLEEGLEEGEVIGMKKGLQKGREEITWNLLQQNVDKDAILKATGLTEDQVFEIQRKFKENP